MSNSVKTTRDIVEKILVDVLRLPSREVKDSDRLVADLGADDFDLVTIRDEIEDEFNVEIPDSDWIKVMLVGDVIAIVERETA